MGIWERFAAVIGGKRVILALGSLYLVFAAVWALVLRSPNMSFPAVLVISSFMAVSGVVLLVGGYRLSNADIHPEFYAAIAGWCLAGIAAMLTILLLYQVQPGAGISNPLRSIPILTGFSCVAGFGVGTYAARAKTNARRLEKQNQRLEQMQSQLEESNERLEQFAYAASHDLQEPLRMVSNYLQLIERRHSDDLDEDGEEFLEYAIDGSKRMKEMIEGLLEYSRVDTQGDPFEPVALDGVFGDVRKDLELQITETDATIDTEELPRVEGDARQLRQLFQNLLSNAIEYSGDEPPRIEIAAERGGKEWIVSVRDYGIGIDPGEQDRIFEVFQRLHTQDEHSGTGIGLALCERISERHGGEIQVHSEPGEGTTFSVTLPAVTEQERDRSIRDDSASA